MIYLIRVYWYIYFLYNGEKKWNENLKWLEVVYDYIDIYIVVVEYLKLK